MQDFFHPAIYDSWWYWKLCLFWSWWCCGGSCAWLRCLHLYFNANFKVCHLTIPFWGTTLFLLTGLFKEGTEGFSKFFSDTRSSTFLAGRCNYSCLALLENFMPKWPGDIFVVITTYDWPLIGPIIGQFSKCPKGAMAFTPGQVRPGQKARS